MSNRRTRALWDGSSPALTPTIPPASKDDKGWAEISKLKALLAAERRRHQRLEQALSRYQAILEQQLTTQREAFSLLGKALAPEPRKGKQ